MNDIIVQIYGIRTVEDARMVVGHGALHIGVSYGHVKHTPGQLTCEQAKEIFDGVQPEAVRVGLTCSTNIDEITYDLKAALPDILHLSGDIDGITPEQIIELKSRFPSLEIMQAIPVLAGVPLEKQNILEYVRNYEEVSDYFLIDTKSASAEDIGATGIAHDRAIDRIIVESTKVRCIIAGGLDENNIVEAIHETHPYGVDSYTHTNYSDERANSLYCKDEAKVIAFIKAAKNA